MRKESYTGAADAEGVFGAAIRYAIKRSKRAEHVGSPIGVNRREHV